MKKYKIFALIGIILMGISSFVACLAKMPNMISLGNIGLIISLIIMFYGFSKWQP